jgi:hypothetical protein
VGSHNARPAARCHVLHSLQQGRPRPAVVTTGGEGGTLRGFPFNDKREGGTLRGSP